MNFLKRSKRGCHVLAFSDTHTGSVTGLRPPLVVTQDGSEHKFNPVQELMWNSFNDMVDEARRWKQETGWPLVVIHVGDAIDGNHHGTHEIWTLDELVMAEVAKETLAPAFDLADAIYMVRGTPSHTGKLARFEEEIAKDLHKEGLPIHKAKYTYTWQHLPLIVNDVFFDIHHTPESNSYVPHTAGSEVNRISYRLSGEYNSTGDRVPDIALRGHTHGYRDSGKTHKTQTFILPPWQQATSWAQNKKWAGKVTPVGGLFFWIHPEGECPYGAPYNHKELIYKPKRDKPEVINAAQF